MRAAQAGDVRAFERLYRVQVGRVYALCLRLCAEPNRAESLTQDSFIRAWQQLASFRGDGFRSDGFRGEGFRTDDAFGAWLRKLSVNVVLADMRATSRRVRRVMPTDDDDVLDGATAPHEPGERLDLERAIATLPEGARAVFVLHDVEGYGHAEIASLMGIAEGTSKAHLHRAREKLKEALL